MKELPGKILLIDDEEYEKVLLEEALLDKQWVVDIAYFSSTEQALKYLKETQDSIFIVLCDINMPKMSGLDFKKIIDQNYELSKKALPFIFVSNGATQEQVQEAYSYRVQGYFQKPRSEKLQADMLDTIIRYWMINQHPNIHRNTSFSLGRDRSESSAV